MSTNGGVGLKPKLKDYFIPPKAPLIDVAEFGKWAFYRAIIAEFVATMLFLYITIATVIGASRNAGCAGVGILGIAWSFGGMIFVLVYCIAGISGCSNSFCAFNRSSKNHLSHAHE